MMSSYINYFKMFSMATQLIHFINKQNEGEETVMQSAQGEFDTKFV